MTTLVFSCYGSQWWSCVLLRKLALQNGFRCRFIITTVCLPGAATRYSTDTAAPVIGMSGKRERRRGHGQLEGRHNRYDLKGAFADLAPGAVPGGRGRDDAGSTSEMAGPSSSVPQRHPPHLRGREIGLFYAGKNKGKKKQEGQQQKKGEAYELHMSTDVQEKITETLNQLNRRVEVGSPTPSYNNVEFRQDYLQNLVGNMKTEAPTDVEVVPLEQLRDPTMDAALKKELSDRKVSNLQYKRMRPFRTKLPAFALRKEITATIQQNQVTVISGETGSGKTTQVPQFILDRAMAEENGSICNIICTQPRRISTITVAERVAEERGEPIGGRSIGYAIRLESKLPTRSGGTLTFLVTGVLLQRLRRDPYLEGVSHIILDEVHERDILTDFTLVILKDLIKKRPDLKVVLMSATLNASKFCEYFGNCGTFEIPGFTFPVTQYYLEDVLESTKFAFEKIKGVQQEKRGSQAALEFNQLILPYVAKLVRENKYSRHVTNQLMNRLSEELNYNLIQETLELIVSKDDSNGAVLIFLAGWSEISALLREIEYFGRFPSSRYVFYPLHSMIPLATQREAFKRPPPGIRKIILATNIAETSITIDDIRFVIDTGRIKQTNFDKFLNLETLDNEWVSRANAQQRRGRAGRVQAGICYHLFSRGRERLLQDFKEPEVRRSRLEEQVLLLKNLKFGNAAAFFRKFMDPPVPMVVEMALERLKKIGALGSSEQLTALGFLLSKLPMDPYTGKMILMAAIFSCVDPILSCAASISYKDCFQVPLGHEEHVDQIRRSYAGETRSDHIAVIRAFQGYEEAKYICDEGNYCHGNYLSLYTMRHLEGVKDQFAQYLYGMKFLPSSNFKDPALNRNSDNTALIKAIIASGLYPNLATAKVKKARGSAKVNAVLCKTHENGRVQIHPKSVNSASGFQGDFESPFLVYFLKMRSTAIFLHDTTMITPFPLVFFGGQLDYLEDSGYGSLGVDGETRFLCTREFYQMIQGLRSRLDEVLETKVQNPGPTCWEEKSEIEKTSEQLLLSAIRDLLTTEYKTLMNEQEEEEGAETEGNEGFDDYEHYGSK